MLYPYCRESSRKETSTVQSLLDIEKEDYRTTLVSASDIPNLNPHVLPKSATNAYFIYNSSGIDIWIKHSNGRIRCHPSEPTTGTTQGAVHIYELFPTDGMVIDATFANTQIGHFCTHDPYDFLVANDFGIIPESPYSFMYDHLDRRTENKLTDYMDITGVQGGQRKAILRQFPTKTLSKYTDGIYVKGTPFMIFTDQRHAEYTPHVLTENLPEREPLKSNGFTIDVCSNSGRFSALYMPFLDDVRKVSVNRINVPPTEEVTIRYKDVISKTENVITGSIDEFLAGEGINGIRFYGTEQEAIDDARRPISVKARKEIEREAERISQAKADLRSEYDVFAENIKVKIKKLEEEKAQREEDLKDLQKLHEAENAKQKKEQRWSKAKEQTSIGTKIADAISSIIGFVVKIFSFA